MTSYDVVVRDARIVDPRNGVDAVRDLAFADGRIAAIGDVHGRAASELDGRNRVLVPGLVDLQVHLTANAGRGCHRNLARAGVTTALELAGPVDEVLALAGTHGAGLTVGVLHCLRPTVDVPSADPTSADIDEALDVAQARGALGVKLHADVPLRPQAIERVFERCDERRVYVAQHSGSTDTASDLTGVRETFALLGDRPLHLAHANSYCRGAIADPVEEAAEVIELLRRHPRVVAESYLAPFNGCSTETHDGRFSHPRLAGWLSDAGFGPDPDGLARAIGSAWAHVIVGDDDGSRRITGSAGVDLWLEQGGQGDLALPVNPISSRVMLATSRDGAGHFDVQALATDGGYLPRNDMAESGMRVVALGGWTWGEFVAKTSDVPARVLGLVGKGHLGVGADGDATLLDPGRSAVDATIAAGRIVMLDGDVTGSGTTVLTAPPGAAAVRRHGCASRVVDPAGLGLFGGVRR